MGATGMELAALSGGLWGRGDSPAALSPCPGLMSAKGLPAEPQLSLSLADL